MAPVRVCSTRPERLNDLLIYNPEARDPRQSRHVRERAGRGFQPFSRRSACSSALGQAGGRARPAVGDRPAARRFGRGLSSGRSPSSRPLYWAPDDFGATAHDGAASGAVASELPTLRARVAGLRAAASKRRADMFEGDSDAIASANLQKRIEELAASVGATIASSETLPAEPRGPYRRIGIRVRLHDKYETLVRLLAALETATPPLITGDMHMQGTLRRTSASEPWRLETVLDVYGFRNGDAPPAPK